jgi:hypothetical protein
VSFWDCACACHGISTSINPKAAAHAAFQGLGVVRNGIQESPSPPVQAFHSADF